MNTRSKYAFLLKGIVIWFVITLFLGALNRILLLYRDVDPNIFDSIMIVVRVFKTILILAMIGALLYIIVQSIAYFQSRFYLVYKVNVFEALFNGILDIHNVYDRINQLPDIKDIEIDFHRQTISASRKDKNYCFLYMDLFGKIEGKENSDYWTIQGRKTRKYGRKTYKKLERFENPIIQCRKYAEDLSLKNQKEYIPFVILSGYHKLGFHSKKILMPYEIISISE
ncbi:MAG: hypothetical protein JXB08_03255 [Bacilli bacterium]|nr:hypothetical protein [Bacilli bacterium]MBN2876307.1 hypothetical protein [Bacilli bacterium]